jgi:glycine/D-amino acid oxidase-like deaminating enzyme
MKAEAVVVGAGFAGAATAWALARAGLREVWVLEREREPGTHASGSNAALLRQVLEDPALLDAALAGAAFWRAPPPDVAAAPPCRPTGSLLLCTAEQAASLAGAARRAGAETLSREDAARLDPAIAGAAAPLAIRTPTDAVADVKAMLHGFLRAAESGGAQVVTGCEVEALELSGGRVAGLRTSRGRIDAPLVVDAGGAWAGALARAAGAPPPPLVPYRRHLFLSRRPRRPASAPWVWDIAHGLYWRAEGDRTLLCACDEDAHAPAAPHVEACVARDLAAKLAARVPAFGPIEVETAWACLRTFAPDRRFVIGPDPSIPGLTYAAGLGGHGVTTAAEVGRLAARAALEPQSAPAVFSPARFVAEGRPARTQGTATSGGATAAAPPGLL